MSRSSSVLILGFVLVPVLAGVKHAQAQSLPALPGVDAVNASVQGGWIAPTRDSTVPSANLDEGGLWGFGVETEFRIPGSDDKKWAGTLGLGYNQLNLSADLGAGRRLRGGLRDLPALTLYFGRASSELYFGATIAMSELVNGRIHTDPPAGISDPGPIKVSGGAFSTGFAAGWEYKHVFIEAGYMMRFFPSLAYDALPSTGFPADLGERMYAGGFMVRIGGTLGVKPPAATKKKVTCVQTTYELTEADDYVYEGTCVNGVVTITPTPKPKAAP